MNTGADGTTRVLLLFPKGQAFNNLSFNKGIDPGDAFSLERKACIFTERAKNGNVAMRVAVTFEAAMDNEDAVKAVLPPNTAAVDDVAALLGMLGMSGGAAGP